MRPFSPYKKSFLITVVILLSILFTVVTYLVQVNFFLLFILLFVAGWAYTGINRIYYRHVLNGAPMVSTTNQAVENLSQILQQNTYSTFVDLGSGIGSICLTASKHCRSVNGYEVNLVPFVMAKLKTRNSHNVNIHLKNFWSIHLGAFDCTYVFGIPYIMADLERKFISEAKVGAVLFSNTFKLPNLQPESKVGNLLIYKKTA